MKDVLINWIAKKIKGNKYLFIIVFILTIIYLFISNFPSFVENYKLTKKIFVKKSDKDTINNRVKITVQSDSANKNYILNNDSTSKRNEECKSYINIIDIDSPTFHHGYDSVKDTSQKFLDVKLFSITVITNPAESEIFIDSVYFGKSNKDLNLEEGDYLITVKKIGYYSYSDIIQIPTQRLLTINLKKHE